MKRSALVSCLLPTLLVAFPAWAQPSDGPVAINPGARSVIIDGIRYRVPKGATHYRLRDGGARLVFVRRKAEPPKRPGMTGRLDGDRGNGTPNTHGPVPAPVPLGAPEAEQPDDDVAADPDLPLGEEPGATPDTRSEPPPTRRPEPRKPPRTEEPRGPQPGDGLTFIRWTPVQNRSNRAWGPTLTDIVNHLPRSYGNTYYDPSRITYGHETTHGINSHLRNHRNPTNKRVNGLYVLNDRGVIIPEPRMRKSSVARYIPRSLRGSRFGTYISGSPAWDDTPTYILDEWVAYVNGGTVGVELNGLGKWNDSWQDGVMGQLEFTVYALALGQAVATHDPDYWKSQPQLREFIAWNARRSMKVFHEGAKLDAFKWDKQDRYLQNFRHGADAKNLRDFTRRTYGAAFTKDVFGF